MKSKQLVNSQADFNSWRKKLLFISLQSIGLTLAALAIIGLKIFYPFHTFLGIGLYVVSFIPSIRRVYLARKTWKRYRSYVYTKKFFIKERWRLVFFIVATGLIISFLWLRPLDNKPFVGMTHNEIAQKVSNDLYTSVTAMDYLETTGNILLEKLDNPLQDFNATKEITAAFDDFIQAVAFSESLTDTHRYFSTIPYSMWDTRVSSFLISYSLYVKKYEMVHRIMTTVSDSEYQKKILNQYYPSFNKNNIYNEMTVRYYHPKTTLRINIGYLYMRVFAYPHNESTEPFILLEKKSRGSNAYLKSHPLVTLTRGTVILLDNTERKMFDIWFPLQKGVANTMGNAILTTRGKDGFITPDQAFEMGKVLEPGDIILQRRNWHVSNVGIPGFWTHAALYTGNLATMDQYFASEFPFNGYESMSAYLREKHPNVYTIYTTPDTDGHQRSVMEAIAPGVVLQSLPISFDADFVVAFRPRLLSKSDMLQAVMRSFEQVGKPYDYNFDFDTSDALVCSELVYNSYFESLPHKKGLHFETSLVSGRRMVSPLDIAHKYVNERNTDSAELSFVYFLRGNEETQKATRSTETEFIESIGWSKFTFFQ
ncbi:MAG: hypothetical protein QG640_160 [Patescibacteria group bacterium]|nr:hypothetical protein [Patescibacteria group bacterium]